MTVIALILASWRAISFYFVDKNVVCIIKIANVFIIIPPSIMEATAERINFYVATEVKNRTSSVEIHDKLVVAWGEQICTLR